VSPGKRVITKQLGELLIERGVITKEQLEKALATQKEEGGRKYPDDRKGYLQWRETLKGFHAGQVGTIMRKTGYSGERVEKVARIILKKNIRDPESQTLEDALCLVFLERQFADLSQKEPEEKMIEILRKTWRKMGERGRAEALKLSLSGPEKILLQKALS
jgi:hypothetical protein